MGRFTLITHDDLDGVTCAILFKAVFPEGNYYLENYNTVNQRVKEVITEEKPKVLILSDISVSEEVAEILDNYHRQVRTEQGFVNLLDHHKTALWLTKYPWATINTTVCGAKLLWSFLNLMANDTVEQPTGNFTILPLYKDLVYHTNDYDMWIHQSPHSAELNDFLYAIGQERFIKRFLQNPSVELTEVERLILEIQQEKDRKYIEEVVKNAKITERYAVAIAERCISQIGAELVKLAPVVAIFNPQKATVSLRGSVDVAEIAKKVDGGGHARAAGFELPKHMLHDEIIRILSEIENSSEDCLKGG